MRLTRFNNLLSAFLFLPLLAAQGQNRTVWQIGKFDESPVEFSSEAKGPITFRVGTSEAQKDWPGRQQTGDSHRIVFSLPSIEGAYSLKIGTLIEQPRVPALRIDVNGHTGTFYLHPKLSYSRSDFSYAFDPHESQSNLTSNSLPLS